MIRSSSYRTQCPRGRHSALEEKQEAPAEPFFVKAEKQGTANSTGQPFFQTKLNIGQPNDKYEQEADAVASKVVNNSGAGTVVQQKEITGIQRLSTSKEEEKAATADARMVKDREIQEKPEIQRLATDKQEEKLGTNDQRMRRDKEIQTKPEIQRMCPGCEQEEKDGSVVQRKKGIKEEEGPVQKKTDGGTATTASSSLSSRIESSSGKGNKLPAGTMAEMSNSFGVDFSHVNVHTNNEAVGMNRELGAQAFTHGSDIYFNSGKYNPETSNGKHLLAHELTHVVQQVGGNEMINKQGNNYCEPAAVNDAIVQSHINSALSRAGNDLKIAFAILRTQRENNCCDVNLAAAEHYMYARLQVAEGSWSFFWVMATLGYNFLKVFRLMPRTGDCPVTRASWAHVRWASQGAVDGEMDYYSQP